jgi:hypothetical protein
MKNKKLGIELYKGEITDFLFDNYIIDGLFYTSESKKVNKNCRNFAIGIEKPTEENPMTTTISKTQDIAIITFHIDNENQSQYFIDKDLSIKELNEIENSDKFVIAEAFNMI